MKRELRVQNPSSDYGARVFHYEVKLMKNPLCFASRNIIEFALLPNYNIALHEARTSGSESLETVYGARVFHGGERGIRTLVGVLAQTRFPVVRLRPAQPPLRDVEGSRDDWIMIPQIFRFVNSFSKKSSKNPKKLFATPSLSPSNP